jgi:DNA-binding LacI/PurR family transcriptional regulator
VAVITRVSAGAEFSGQGLAQDTPFTAPFTARQRMAGWLDALGAVGIEPMVGNAASGTEAAGFDAMQPLLDLPEEDRPTAVLAYSDRIALGAMQAIQDRGCRVPDDVSVVGFDDAPFAERTRPALTTVRQDVARKGHEATALLTEAIDTRMGQTTDHRFLPTELVVRGSTRAVQ